MSLPRLFRPSESAVDFRGEPTGGSTQAAAQPATGLGGAKVGLRHSWSARQATKMASMHKIDILQLFNLHPNRWAGGSRSEVSPRVACILLHSCSRIVLVNDARKRRRTMQSLHDNVESLLPSSYNIECSWSAFKLPSEAIAPSLFPLVDADLLSSATRVCSSIHWSE